MADRPDRLALADSRPDAFVGNELQRRHMVELLATVEREANISQRKLATELGVALGLVNTYLRRCVRKGLIKVRQAPTRRYAYYLTPKGFTEKSRLTAEYLSWSLTFFRRARGECAAVMTEARLRGWRRIGLSGSGDLAEIAILTAGEQCIEIAGIVDPALAGTALLGTSIHSKVSDLSPPPDGWIVTAIDGAQRHYDVLVRYAGSDRAIPLPLLAVREQSGGRRR